MKRAMERDKGRGGKATKLVVNRIYVHNSEAAKVDWLVGRYEKSLA